MKSRIAALVLLVSLAPALGACTTADFVRVAEGVFSFVQSSLAKGRAGLRSYCSSIGTADNEAAILQLASNVKSCKARVRTQNIVNINAAICNNVDNLSVLQIRTFTKNLADAFAAAQQAVRDGC